MTSNPTTQTDPGAPARHTRGILLVVAAFCVLPALDGIAKFLIDDHHVAQLVWARMFFQSLVIGAWFALSGRLKGFRLSRTGLLYAAMVLIWLANFPIIMSLAYLSLASAFALIMTAPLMVTALSGVLLGERIGIHRWIAVAAGFVGALIIIRPGLGVFHWAALLPLLSAVFFALYQIGVKKLSDQYSSLELIFYASIIPLLGSCLIAPFYWTPPSADAWLLMAIMGAGAGVGHYMLIAALNHAPASLLAPFMYIQMISSTVIGFAMFGDLPDAMTVLGAGVIVGAGLYGMWRHRD